MNAETQQCENTEREGRQLRRTYVKPRIQRVDLALEETLSTGCKSFDSCENEGNPTEGS